MELLAKEKAVLNINLFMMKQIPKKQIPTVLSAATLCTALFIDKPEMRANSADKFFDALAASTPILINYGGCMVDLIEKNQCGLVTWNKSIYQAAEEVVSLITDKTRLNEYALNAKKLAMTQFSRDQLADQLNQVLQLTLGQSSLQPEDVTQDYYA